MQEHVTNLMRPSKPDRPAWISSGHENLVLLSIKYSSCFFQRYTGARKPRQAIPHLVVNTQNARRNRWIEKLDQAYFPLSWEKLGALTPNSYLEISGYLLDVLCIYGHDSKDDRRGSAAAFPLSVCGGRPKAC
jgi:hypothetical protein